MHDPGLARSTSPGDGTKCHLRCPGCCALPPPPRRRLGWGGVARFFRGPSRAAFGSLVGAQPIGAARVQEKSSAIGERLKQAERHMSIGVVRPVSVNCPLADTSAHVSIMLKLSRATATPPPLVARFFRGPSRAAFGSLVGAQPIGAARVQEKSSAIGERLKQAVRHMSICVVRPVSANCSLADTSARVSIMLKLSRVMPEAVNLPR